MWTRCPGFVASLENFQHGFLYMGLESISWAMRFMKLATNTEFVSGNSISKAFSGPPLDKTFLYKHRGHIDDVLTLGSSCCVCLLLKFHTCESHWVVFPSWAVGEQQRVGWLLLFCWLLDQVGSTGGKMTLFFPGTTKK